MKPTIAVDLAKSVFEVAVSKRPGRVDKRLRLSRKRLLSFFAQQPPATDLRTLLIHGARTLLWAAKGKNNSDRLRRRRDGNPVGPGRGGADNHSGPLLT